MISDFCVLLLPAKIVCSGAVSSWHDLRSVPAFYAHRLRRKGHLKEQDSFISFLLRMHEMHSCLEVMTKMERWIMEHRRDPRGSQLSRMVPSVVRSHAHIYP